MKKNMKIVFDNGTEVVISSRLIKDRVAEVVLGTIPTKRAYKTKKASKKMAERDRTKWTKEEDAEVKRLLSDGMKASQVARIVGRTTGSVSLRRWRMVKNKELALAK